MPEYIVVETVQERWKYRYRVTADSPEEAIAMIQDHVEHHEPVGEEFLETLDVESVRLAY